MVTTSIQPPADLSAMDVIDRVPHLKVAGAHAKERFRNAQIDCCSYAYAHGIDKPEIVAVWKQVIIKNRNHEF